MSRQAPKKATKKKRRKKITTQLNKPARRQIQRSDSTHQSVRAILHAPISQ
jgi:hypothetical protein